MAANALVLEETRQFSRIFFNNKKLFSHQLSIIVLNIHHKLESSSPPDAALFIKT